MTIKFALPRRCCFTRGHHGFGQHWTISSFLDVAWSYLWIASVLLFALAGAPPPVTSKGEIGAALVPFQNVRLQEESQMPVEADALFSPWRVETAEALKAEVIAAEAALFLRADVDGAAVVYDSPGVSIALRKVSPERLANEWVELKAPDGAELSIPPGAKQRHGGPVTITITSYHTGGRIKQLPGRVKYGKGRRLRRRLNGDEAQPVGEDRVDFFLEKEEGVSGPARHSVSWAGTVDVRVRDPTKGRGKVKGGFEQGLGVSVPAHHTDYQVAGGTEDTRWPEERQALLLEVEGLVTFPMAERQRAYRRLALKWHPDKNPGDEEKASTLFQLLQELRERLLNSNPLR